MKNQKKSKELQITKFRKWLGSIFIIFFVIYFFKIAIGNFLLEKTGFCKNAFLTNEVNHFRSHPDALVYNFWVNGKVYDGNSNVEDLSKAGDSICVVYLDWMPNINRPLSFFDEPVNCNCK
jgi:hypothetical protein